MDAPDAPKLPTFLIFGVQKAGTTSIYEYLKQHPQIYMSPVKETHFFTQDWELATSEDQAQKRNGITSFEKYCQQFAGATLELARGEVSPNYLLYYETSAALIKRYVPDVKLIAILRNPVDRAYSDYLMHVRDVLGPGNRLSYQVQHRAQQSHILRKGFYYDGIKHYLTEFGPDRVKVFLYDDLCQNPIALMQAMYHFIGVDVTFCPDVSRRAQVARIPKRQWLNRLLQGRNPIRTATATVMKTFMPANLRQNLRQNLIALNSKGKSDELLTAEERQQLFDLYREDMLRLQDLLQRDLSSWLQCPSPVMAGAGHDAPRSAGH